ALEQDLLRGLRGDAPEGAPRLPDVEHRAELLVLLARFLGVARMPEDLKPELLADLGLETVLAGDVERDVAFRLGDLLDHDHVLEQLDLTRIQVEPRLELARRSEHRLSGL